MQVEHRIARSSGAIEISTWVTPASASAGSGRSRSNRNIGQPRPSGSRPCPAGGSCRGFPSPWRRAAAPAPRRVAEAEAEQGAAHRRLPFRAHLGIRLAAARARGGGAARSVGTSRAQRPDRRTAHQRRGIAEQRLRLGGQRRLAAVADRDQHVADEPVATDALDRRAGEQRRGRPRRRAPRARPAAAPPGPRAPAASARPWPAANLFQGRRRGSRRSHRCGCPSAAATRAGSGPCARWSGSRCSAAHRAGRARGRRRSGRRRGSAGSCRNGRAPARRAAARGRSGSRPGTARSRSSRETRLVCLPCQPRPACCGQRLFQHRRGIDEHLDLGRRMRPASQPASSLSRPLSTS